MTAPSRAVAALLLAACAAGPLHHDRWKQCAQLDTRENPAPIHLVRPVRLPTPWVYAPRREWVDVQFAVTEDGRTADVEVVESFPTDRYERSVLTAVSRWRFCPRSELAVAYPERIKTRWCFSTHAGCPRCRDCNLRF
jgi:TonB family protein